MVRRTRLLAFIVILLCAVEVANATRHTALSRRRLVQRHSVTPTSVAVAGSYGFNQDTTQLVELEAKATSKALQKTHRNVGEVIVAGLNAVGALSHMSKVSETAATTANTVAGVASTMDAIADGVIIAKAALTVIGVIVGKFADYFKGKVELAKLKVTVEDISAIYTDQLDSYNRIKSLVMEAVAALETLSREDQARITPAVSKICQKINLQSLNRVMSSVKAKLEDFQLKLDKFDSRGKFVKWLWAGTYLNQWKSIHASLIGSMTVFTAAQNVVIQNSAELRDELSTLEDPDTGVLLLQKLGGATTQVARMKDGFENLAGKVDGVVTIMKEQMDSVKDEIMTNRDLISGVGSRVEAVHQVVSMNHNYLKGLTRSMEEAELRRQTKRAIEVQCVALETELSQVKIQMSRSQVVEISNCRTRLARLKSKLRMLARKPAEEVGDAAAKLADESDEEMAGDARDDSTGELVDKALELNRNVGDCRTCQSFYEINPAAKLERLVAKFGLDVDRAREMFVSLAEVGDNDFALYYEATRVAVSKVEESYSALKDTYDVWYDRCITLKCRDKYEGLAVTPVCAAVSVDGPANIAEVADAKLAEVRRAWSVSSLDGFWDGKTLSISGGDPASKARVCSMCCEGAGSLSCRRGGYSEEKCFCVAAVTPHSSFCPVIEGDPSSNGTSASDSSSSSSPPSPDKFDCSSCKYPQCAAELSRTKRWEWNTVNAAYAAHFKTTGDNRTVEYAKQHLYVTKEMTKFAALMFVLDLIESRGESTRYLSELLSEVWVDLVAELGALVNNSDDDTLLQTVQYLDRIQSHLNGKGLAAMASFDTVRDKCFQLAILASKAFVADEMMPSEDVFTHSVYTMEGLQSQLESGFERVRRAGTRCGPLPDVGAEHTHIQAEYVEAMLDLRRQVQSIVSTYESSQHMMVVDLAATRFGGCAKVLQSDTYITEQREFLKREDFPESEIAQGWKDGFRLTAGAWVSDGWYVVMSKFDTSKLKVEPHLGVSCSARDVWIRRNSLEEVEQQLAVMNATAWALVRHGTQYTSFGTRGCVGVKTEFVENSGHGKLSKLEELAHTGGRKVIGGTVDHFIVAKYEEGTDIAGRLEPNLSVADSLFVELDSQVNVAKSKPYRETLYYFAEGKRITSVAQGIKGRSESRLGWQSCKHNFWGKDACRAQQMIVLEELRTYPVHSGHIIDLNFSSKRKELSVSMLAESDVAEQKVVRADEADEVLTLITKELDDGWHVVVAGHDGLQYFGVVAKMSIEGDVGWGASGVWHSAIPPKMGVEEFRKKWPDRYITHIHHDSRQRHWFSYRHGAPFKQEHFVADSNAERNEWVASQWKKGGRSLTLSGEVDGKYFAIFDVMGRSWEGYKSDASQLATTIEQHGGVIVPSVDDLLVWKLSSNGVSAMTPRPGKAVQKWLLYENKVFEMPSARITMEDLEGKLDGYGSWISELHPPTLSSSDGDSSVNGGASSIDSDGSTASGDGREAEEAASAASPSPSSGPEEVVVVLHSSEGDLYLNPHRRDNKGPCMLGRKPYYFVKEKIDSKQFALKSVDTNQYLRSAGGNNIVCDRDVARNNEYFSIQDGGIFCTTGGGRDRWFNEAGAVKHYKSKDGLENGFKLEPVPAPEHEGEGGGK